MKTFVKARVLGVVAAAVISASAFGQSANPQLADPSMNQWMRGQQGPITRDQYMAEAGRRWDAMDTSHKGLTPKQIDQMYGGSPTPNMVKKGNNMTNPTGTEPKGESGGGK